MRRTLPHRPPVSLDVLSCFDDLRELADFVAKVVDGFRER
jgi:hypothetical protein